MNKENKERGIQCGKIFKIKEYISVDLVICLVRTLSLLFQYNNVKLINSTK